MAKELFYVLLAIRCLRYYHLLMVIKVAARLETDRCMVVRGADALVLLDGEMKGHHVARLEQ